MRLFEAIFSLEVGQKDPKDSWGSFEMPKGSKKALRVPLDLFALFTNYII